MTNPADTPEVEVDMAIKGVIDDIKRLEDLAVRWPHLVQGQLKDIETARIWLGVIVGHLKACRDAQVDFLGAG